MEQKKEKGLSLYEVIKNNVYAIKLIWQISPKRVMHMAFYSFIDYFTWMFYSTYFMRYVVNAIENGYQFNRIVMYIAISCVVTMFLQLYAAYFRNVTVPLDDVKVYSKLYSKMYKKAENVELACFEDSEFYNKYTMALDDACSRITTVTELIFNIIAALAAGIFTYVAMYRIDKMMLLFIIAPLIGNFVFGTLVNKINFSMYKKMTPNNRRTEYVNRVMYLADYAKEIRLSKIFNVLKNTYDNAVDENIKIVKSYKGRNIVYGFFQYYFSYTIIFEGVLLYGAYCALVSKTLTPGELAILTSMMVIASWILIVITRNLLQCSQNGMFMHNLRTFLEYKEVIPEDWDGDTPDSEINSVEFKNVGFSYKDGKNVISNLSFRLEKGKSIALVGHNGAGKTTIVKLLFRLYDPTEGEILVNGRNIKEYNLKEYRNLFAAAFQDFKIFAGTVTENVLMGRVLENSEKRVNDALKDAGVYDKVMSLKNGVNTILTKEFDEDGAVFSGGEFQKLVVARAFANSSPIKVFDEPSSALDPIAEHELFESILEQSKNSMMVFISHRLSSVKNADEVLMLEGGMLIERGTHYELMQNNGKYADMFMKQAKNYQPEESVEAAV